MRLLYISDHAILEQEELQLFTDLGHDCFSLGAYHNLGHPDLPRPAVDGLIFHEDLNNIYVANPNRSELHPELIAWADVIVFMHAPHLIAQNWDRIKHKRVIWRSIGQSTPHIEDLLRPYREQGLEIVRYSPKEANINGSIGEDAMIRFYKDERLYSGWDGSSGQVVSFAQSLKGRRDFCHYDEIMKVVETFNGKVYGPGNEDLGQYNGGQVPFEQQLTIMKHAAAMPYGGTWPAAYTLSFMEALMMGLPIVAISKTLAHIPKFENIDFYEVDELLAQISGIVCDSPEQMVKEAKRLVEDGEHAKVVSKRQRELAIELFGKRKIIKQWKDFLGGSEE